MRRPSLKNLKFPNEATAKAGGGGSREAIVGAAQRLFLERGFGAVSMDDLAPAAGVDWPHGGLIDPAIVPHPIPAPPSRRGKTLPRTWLSAASR